MEKKRTSQVGPAKSRYLHFALLFIIFQITAFTLQAQVKVSGLVQDKKNTPVNGATVTVKGTNLSVLSDANGMYSISVPDKKSVLVFTSVGFLAREESVGERTSINVGLTESAADLEGIVITGYGGS